jgi:hypothetical protein
MSTWNYKRLKLLRVSTVLITILILLVWVVTIAYAAKYNINPNDTSITDWNGIGTFLTDPSGDASDTRNDIIAVWVATGTDNSLNFLMEVQGTSALSSCTASNPTGTAALIDCDNDGVEREQTDRIVNWGCYADGLTVCAGDRSQCQQYQSADYGQKVASGGHGYVEWKVLEAELHDQSPYIPGECYGDVGIRFRIVRTNSGVIYDETDLAHFNVPTAVTMKELRATSRLRGGLAVALTGVLAVAGAGMLVWRRRVN